MMVVCMYIYMYKIYTVFTCLFVCTCMYNVFAIDLVSVHHRDPAVPSTGGVYDLYQGPGWYDSLMCVGKCVRMSSLYGVRD